MRALILSDIHGNYEALDAVLAAADGQFDVLWNLGDMVGYGASPNQVIDRIRPLSAVAVRGNHDRVCCGLTSPNAFNPVARTAALWTAKELTPENLEWLKQLPRGPVHPEGEPEVLCAHGSPLHEDHYILTMRDAWAPLQQSGASLTFFGHTHVQGGFSQMGHDWNELRPRYENRNDPVEWVLDLAPATRNLVNPGSVGQPRDSDWRAAFAIYDSDLNRITFRRTPYDVMTAQGHILMAHLPERLALRLREGR